MKRILCGVMVIAAITIFGCAKPGPENAAKDYVKKQFNIKNAVKIDTSNLKYTVTEENEGKATVKIAGKIDYEEELLLIKEMGKWTVSKKQMAPEMPEIVH